MTSPEPRDEPSLRPPQDPASHAEPDKQPAPSAEPDTPPAAHTADGLTGGEPPRRATPFGEPVDPFHVDENTPHPSPAEERPSRSEGHPAHTGEKPGPTTEYTRPSHPRTEQMKRNTEYAERQHAEEAPKPGPKDTGKYKGEVPPLTLPPDPLRPFSSGFVKRKRGREWPVLVFALVVVVVVVVGCCLAGFALFSVWHPFAR